MLFCTVAGGRTARRHGLLNSESAKQFRMKEHKLFVIASLLLSRACASTLEDALASDYASCYDPSGTCSCTDIWLDHHIVGGLTGTFPAALGSCSDLEVLNLCCNSLTGTIPASLGSCSSLTALRSKWGCATLAYPSNLRSKDTQP